MKAHRPTRICHALLRGRLKKTPSASAMAAGTLLAGVVGYGPRSDCSTQWAERRAVTCCDPIAGLTEERTTTPCRALRYGWPRRTSGLTTTVNTRTR